jgi:hypothetical protein
MDQGDNHMKRPRPHIPLSVRVHVAERQADKHSEAWAHYLAIPWQNLGDRLQFLLTNLLPKGAQLDHDPALIVRPFDHKTGKYLPEANDPDFLIYRGPRDHLQKTIGRKADAEKTVTTKGSDIWLKSKFDRLEGRTKQRPKAKIPGRPFPEGRPFPKRGKAQP